jgi:hypothetical protein
MAKGSGATGHGTVKSIAATVRSVLSVAASLPTKTGAIRLATLREALKGMSRAEQDSQLSALHKSGKIALYREDNTPKMTAADHAAALSVGGNPRHILYVK